VAMDLRGHGWTTAKVEDTYGSEVAARDILKLMVCHALCSFYSASDLFLCFKGGTANIRLPSRWPLDGRKRRVGDSYRSSRESIVPLSDLIATAQGSTYPTAMLLTP
jgi:hypothetical protein